MDKYTLKAEDRKVSGRKVKNLRKEGQLPANIFGKKIKSASIQVSEKDFLEIYKKAGETGIVEIELGKEVKPALVHNVQMHPVTDAPLHVDFLQVDLKEKVTAEVPVDIVGESPAQKQSLGTVVKYINEVEVEALPMDLPDHFEINIDGLTEVDQSIKIADLKVDKSKVEIKADPEDIIVKVEPPQKEEEVVAPAPAEGEAPVEGETAPTEGGEQPAEGEKKEEAPKE